MSDIDPRVKLSPIAAYRFDRLDARRRQLVLSALADLANGHTRGEPHAANNNKYFSDAPWADSRIFRGRGVEITYGLRETILEIDWFDFDPPLPRGGGRSAHRLVATTAIFEFEILPI